MSNVEYTEFERLGIDDRPASNGSRHSAFPANTNVLYVGLQAVERVVQQVRGGCCAYLRLLLVWCVRCCVVLAHTHACR